MYFLDGRSQGDIARVLGTSRSNVSRMLSSARSTGVVEIRINDGHGRDGDLEQALSERFGLTQVRVSAFRPRADVLAAAGELAAEWLDDTLRDGQTLAIAWGTTLQAVVSCVVVEQPRELEVVPLVGGLSIGGPLVAVQDLVRELAGRLGATYRYLHGPALLQSEKARDALLAEPSISDVIARARSADVAMVGIGAMGSGSTLHVLRAIRLTDAQRQAFMAKNPVGDICCRFFDAEGQPIRGVVHDRVLGVELADLRRIPTVVAVATGAEKATGALAALGSGIINVLITDASLAHSLLTAAGVL
jgi:DNA-binding transcriptional regulator LsrR (DeoR family)